MTNKIVGHGFSLEVATIEMLIRTVERESLMAQLKELKKNLLEIIAVSLKEHGFKKSDQAFHKKTDVGKLHPYAITATRL
ncbi:MAG TPA: hypothetical protein VMT04_03645, partial [Terriglobales bacterium]|nr:hypothetical protein [Terriglobales bacterium]